MVHSARYAASGAPAYRLTPAPKRQRWDRRKGLTPTRSFIIFGFMNVIPADLFGAFANPTRLRILNLLLAAKEICVCDLCEVLGLLQPKVSRHLAILRDTGLVEVRTNGKWKFYALASPPTALHRTLVRCVGNCLGEFEELEADRQRLAGLETQLRCS